MVRWRSSRLFLLRQQSRSFFNFLLISIALRRAHQVSKIDKERTPYTVNFITVATTEDSVMIIM